MLAVGVREPGEVARLLRELGEAGAAALVVRAAADASGVVLLGLAPEVSWAVAASVLRALGPGREPAPVSTRPPVTCSAWPRRWPSSSAHP